MQVLPGGAAAQLLDRSRQHGHSIVGLRRPGGDVLGHLHSERPARLSFAGSVASSEERRMSVGAHSRSSYHSNDAGLFGSRMSYVGSDMSIAGRLSVMGSEDLLALRRMSSSDAGLAPEVDRTSGMRTIGHDSDAMTRVPSHWTTCLVLREANLVRSVWNAVVAALLIYTATVFPYKLCFMDMKVADQYGKAAPRQGEWPALENTIDTLFWIDLVATFFFSYRDDQLQEVMDVRLVASRYIRSTFAVNLIACIAPYLVDLLTPVFGNSSGSRAVPLLRLIRLLRLAKLISWMTESPFWRWVQSLKGVKIFNFTIALLWVVHMNACGWYLCAALHSDTNTTWLRRRYVYEPRLHDGTQAPMLPLVDESHFIQWLNAMYFGVVTLFTVGFGDFYAITIGEVMFVFCMLIEGAVVHAIVVGQMIHTVTSADNENTELVEKKQLLRRFAHHAGLNHQTSNELVKCIVRSKGALEGYDQEQVRKMVMVSLPDDVMEKLHHLMFKGKLAKNRLISVCCKKGSRLPPRFPLLVALLVHTMTFPPGEMVYYWSDHAWNVYLVLEGTFAYVARPHASGGICEVPCGPRQARGSMQDRIPMSPNGSDGKTSIALHGALGQASTPTLFPYLLFCGGTYFGEFEMFVQKPRVSSVRCEIAGTLLVLSKVELNRLCDEFPDFAETWKDRTLRKEGHRKASLKRLTHGRSIRHFAAYTIQRHYRKRLPNVHRGDDRMDTFMKLEFLRPEEEATSDCASGSGQATEAGLPLQSLDLHSLRGELHDVLKIRTDLDALRAEVRSGQEQVRRQLARVIQVLGQRRQAAGAEWA